MSEADAGSAVDGAEVTLTIESDISDPPTYSLLERRLALGLFALLCVASVVALLNINDFRYFLTDEWSILSRNGFDLGDLIEDHNGHQVVMPILIYEILERIFGWTSYTPYLATSIAFLIGLSSLLRTVLRRSGVNPWLSSVAAFSILLFGPGEELIGWAAFGISENGAISFALIQMLLADHDGDIDRRDWIGLAAGVFALTWGLSAVFVIMGTGLSTLVRRGLRPALVHTLPPGLLFGAWFLVIEPQSLGDPKGSSTDIGSALTYPARGLVDAVGAIPADAALGAALLATGLAGVLLLVRRNGWTPETRARLAVPLGLFVFFLPHMAAVGATRSWTGSEPWTTSRYQFGVVITALPLLVVGLDELTRRIRFTWVAASLLLLVGLPTNVHLFDNNPLISREIHADAPRFVNRMAFSPYLAEVDPRVRPDGVIYSFVTVGDLRHAVAQGYLVAPPGLQPATGLSVQTRLLLLVDPSIPRPETCLSINTPVPVSVSAGDTFWVEPGSGTADGEFRIQGSSRGVASGETRVFDPGPGSGYAVQLTMEIHLSPANDGGELNVCQ